MVEAIWRVRRGSGGVQRQNQAPYRIAVHLSNVVTMWRALYSSALTLLVDGRWGQEVLYKHKITFLPTSFTTVLHCSVKHKQYECPDFCRGRITVNTARPMQMSD